METLFRGSRKPPESRVPCTQRGEQVCSSASTRSRAFGLRLGCVAGPAWGYCSGSAGVSGSGSRAGCCREPKALVLFERRLFLGLVVERSAEGRRRHPQRGGQLGQGELGGPQTTAAFLDLVDGHSR